MANNKGILSEQIMNYYLKYGQNRDLEKYLRLKSSRSSSEGSLHHEKDNFERAGKSLENIALFDNIREAHSSKTHTTVQADNKTHDQDEFIENVQIKPENTKHLPKVTTSQKKKETKTKRDKSYNINLESLIEINLPQNVEKATEPMQTITMKIQTSPADKQPNPSTGNLNLGGKIKVSDSKTDESDEADKTECDDAFGGASGKWKTGEGSSFKLDRSIATSKYKAEEEGNYRPIVGTQTAEIAKMSIQTQTPLCKVPYDEKFDQLLEAPIPRQFKDAEIACRDIISPTSSIASNKQRLEWDSLADVGYNLKDHHFRLLGTNDLNDLEKEALKKYFDKQGIVFNEQKIVVFQTPIKSKKKEDKSTSVSDMKCKGKEKWELIFKKYKEKYKDLDDTSSLLHSFSTPDAKSTPIITKEPKMIEAIKKVDFTNKYSQTSLIKNISKEVPVSPEAQPNLEEEEHNQVSLSEQSKTSSPMVKPGFDNEALYETTGSFEFFQGSSKPEKNENDNSLAVTLDMTSKTGSIKKNSLSSSSQQTCVSNSSEKPQIQSSYDEELNLAVAFLKSLIESKSMNKDLKKSLVSEILQKITKNTDSGKDGKLNKNEKDLTDSNFVSGLQSSGKNSIGSNENSSLMNNFLQPQTHSEIDFENHKVTEDKKKTITTLDRPTLAKKSQKSCNADDLNSEKYNSPLTNFVNNEKLSQINWINQEIDHLGNLKQFLLQSSLPNKTLDDTNPDQRQSLRSENVYENIEKLRKKIDEFKKRKCQSENYSLIQQQITSEESMKNKQKTENSNKSSNRVSYDSHSYMKKIIQSRSKLKTPSKTPNSSSVSCSTSEESIFKFIKQRKEKFVEQYEQNHGKLYNEEKNIYTRPYSENAKESYVVSQYTTKNEQTEIDGISTSISTLSQSISIPVSSSSTTTKYHYDLKSDLRPQRLAIGIASQTTDSLAKTKPIFVNCEKKRNALKCHCVHACKCSERQNETIPSQARTIRIDATKKDKRVQTCPPAVAYCLTFDEENNNDFSPREKTDSTKSNRMTKSRKDLRNNSKIRLGEEGNTYSTIGSDTSIASSELLTLEQQLKACRPHIFQRIEERNNFVADLKQMRDHRNFQRNKLSQVCSDTSKDHLNQYLKQLPPAPLATKRLFSTKTLKQKTRNQCKNLPEIQRKKEIEKLNNIKKHNRVMTELFNKNLQKLALKGKIDLSNSVCIQCDF